MRTPQSYVTVTLKVLHSFSHIGSRLACPSGTQEWPQRGREGRAALPPSLPLSRAATRLAPKPMVHCNSVHFKHINITEKEINAI